MSSIISVEHLSKIYRLGAIGGATVQQDLASWWARVRGRTDPALKIGQEHVRQIGEQFLALDDVSFEVTPAEVLGVIGRNGAGKSTLLKILSQVTAPTSGQITLWGRVASLLEVGTGFHPELTGRENIFLNGAILGMTKSEIRMRFDEIVAFSECEQFIDTPVKRYSSGMYVRLAFAVAAHLEPEILIVDEVLAVGDSQFQKKCLGKMRDVSRGGRTVLFVSHSMTAISALCTRAILLREGRIAVDAETSEAVAAYQAEGAAHANLEVDFEDKPHRGSGKARFTSVRIQAVDHNDVVLDGPTQGSDLIVDARIECFADFRAANVAILLYDVQGYRLIDVGTAIQGEFLTLKSGQSASVRFRLHDLLLKPGAYSLTLYLGRAYMEEIDLVEHASVIEVLESATSKHSEIYPGPYQCRFTHEVFVDSDVQTI